MPQDSTRTPLTGADDIERISDVMRVRYRDYDQWKDKDLRKLPDLYISLFQKFGTSEEPTWTRMIPKSYEKVYGAHGNARFMRAVMDESERRGIAFDSTGWLVSGLLGEPIGLTAEQNEMITDRDYRFKLPSGREVVADTGEYYAYARAASVELYRDRNLALQKENKLKPSDMYGTILVPVSTAATEALAEANPKYAKAIREYKAYADTRGGFGVEVSANDAYELGYLRRNLDKIQPDPNPATVVDREQVCRDLPPVETRIFQNKPVELSEAYDAAQLRRLVGSCDDVEGANPTAAMVIPDAGAKRLVAAR